MPSSDTDHQGLVWYAAYGSNLDPARFDCYLHGGCPPGATRTYPGTRDREPALATRPAELTGRLHFGWHSPTWGGGVAFFDPTGDAPVRSTAYLLTRRQFADVVEQEMWRDPGADHDLAELLEVGQHRLGPGHYETLHVVGRLEDRPVLTFTADELPEQSDPAPAYLDTMRRGLRDVHALDEEAVEDYLSRW